MFVFCKVNVLLFSSLLNMIIASVGRWFCGRLVGESVGKLSVVGWSVGRWVGGRLVGGWRISQNPEKT